MLAALFFMLERDEKKAVEALKCTLFTGHPVRRVHFALYD